MLGLQVEVIDYHQSFVPWGTPAGTMPHSEKYSWLSNSNSNISFIDMNFQYCQSIFLKLEYIYIIQFTLTKKTNLRKTHNYVYLYYVIRVDLNLKQEYTNKAMSL